jgi:uncharacterized membrane protein YphA (DoxX/SURF4 family)
VTTHAVRAEREAGIVEARSSERVIRILRWSLVLVFVGAGVSKLVGVPSVVTLFALVGLGQWFRYAVGIYELVGAALVASSRTTVAGAAALSALMVGAAATEVLILERAPLSSGATLAALIVLATLVRGSGQSATRFP